jgi:hypothetical protein
VAEHEHHGSCGIDQAVFEGERHSEIAEYGHGK